MESLYLVISAAISLDVHARFTVGLTEHCTSLSQPLSGRPLMALLDVQGRLKGLDKLPLVAVDVVGGRKRDRQVGANSGAEQVFVVHPDAAADISRLRAQAKRGGQDKAERSAEGRTSAGTTDVKAQSATQVAGTTDVDRSAHAVGVEIADQHRVVAADRVDALLLGNALAVLKHLKGGENCVVTESHACAFIYVE